MSDEQKGIGEQIFERFVEGIRPDTEEQVDRDVAAESSITAAVDDPANEEIFEHLRAPKAPEA